MYDSKYQWCGLHRDASHKLYIGNVDKTASMSMLTLFESRYTYRVQHW